MRLGETATPAGSLQEAMEAARESVERAAHVRREIAAELGRAVQRMELGATDARRVENAFSVHLSRIANALKHPPRRWVGVGESHVLAATEALVGAMSGLATAAVEVGAAAGEQLRKRQELRRSFRRIPDLSHAAEQSGRHLTRVFQRRAVAAVVGRLTTSGRVLARFTTGRRGLNELLGQLKGLLAPLERVRTELGFFTCRGRAVAVSAAPRARRREEIELVVDPEGELMLVWDLNGAPRLTVYPAPGTAWHHGKAGWRLCFSLPQGDRDGRHLRIERPALAAWTDERHARLVRTGVLAWEERPRPTPARAPRS